MNVITDQKPIIEITGFDGMYSRGAYDNCPTDHLTDCMNCIFPGPKQVTIREPVTLSSVIAGRTILSYKVINIAAGARLLTLNSTGAFYDETLGPTLLGTFTGADDFVSIDLFSRTYICFTRLGRALAGSVLYYYDGTNFVPAAGVGPSSGPTLADVNPGNVGPGVYGVAVSFQSRTGYLSPPSPVTFITVPGGTDIELSAIPTGPAGTVARVILVTQANQLTLFFLPGGTINNNTTTTLSINFYDTSLIASADYLNDILTSIPAGSSLRFYNGRLIVIGQLIYPDNMILSDVSDPETFNSVTNIVSFPVDYGDNSCNTGLVILGVLYVMKPNGTYSTQDNGSTPNTWAVTIVDSALGAWNNGISIFASSSSAQDVFDSAFIMTQRGLMLFQAGTYTAMPFTKKIESLIGLFTNALYAGSFFYRIQIAHDVWAKRVYITVPLEPPATYGAPFTLALAPFTPVILMMDYQEGLTPDTVKWSPWSSGLLVYPNTICKMMFENFTLSFVAGTTPIFQLSFCIGDTNIYKIIIPTLHKTQNYTAAYLPDVGTGATYPINQYIITPSVSPPGDGVYVWTMLNFSIYGYGLLVLGLFLKDRSSFVSLRGFQLTSYVGTGYDLQRLINFTGEGVQILIAADQSIPSGNNGFFQITSIDVYGNKLWNMRPALLESA